ncbi:hypothetical protein A1A1_08654 [Planococcus antarcticus DSM 14505]|uniref:Uncharacterized protein n=1 Tax=Planococcus antarcticus DSM 14505 TaxID=1185653 RepID=A0A1C7DFU2_9BACL|nr:hypothetical protein [Planococcus antarcticus]ANU10356.1 hypothetical protein BBH88_08590 [Planococcus antarcticus DSM 14505]EIM06872.1 hypothetical protein A1A1_08654 [Planococcus antarcticus DSM 14505]
MHKLVAINRTEITENKIEFFIEETEPAEAIEASGQMLTDSDNQAFVYLLDTGTDYIYVQFDVHTWPALTKALQQEKVPLLTWGKQVMPLANFHEELWMLVENIEGNDNYGEAFRTAVEQSFHEALASRS